MCVCCVVGLAYYIDPWNTRIINVKKYISARSIIANTTVTLVHKKKTGTPHS